MSASRAASKSLAKRPSPRLPELKEFVWEGRDKRGTVMKGEQLLPHTTWRGIPVRSAAPAVTSGR